MLSYTELKPKLSASTGPFFTYSASRLSDCASYESVNFKLAASLNTCEAQETGLQKLYVFVWRVKSGIEGMCYLFVCCFIPISVASRAMSGALGNLRYY